MEALILKKPCSSQKCDIIRYYGVVQSPSNCFSQDPRFPEASNWTLVYIWQCRVGWGKKVVSENGRKGSLRCGKERKSLRRTPFSLFETLGRDQSLSHSFSPHKALILLFHERILPWVVYVILLAILRRIEILAIESDLQGCKVWPGNVSH